MELEQLLALMNDRFNGFHTLWSFYISVSLGLLAYVAATFTTAAASGVRILLIAAFILFASVNLDALLDVGAQRDALTKLAKSRLNDNAVSQALSPDEGELLGNVIKAGKPPSSGAIWAFHLAIDALAIVVIWYMPGALARTRRAVALDRSPVAPRKSRYKHPAIVSRDEINQAWVLEDTFAIQTAEYSFSVPKGFSFDLASVPRPLWWLIAPFELSMAAPLVHDYFYASGGQIAVIRVPQTLGGAPFQKSSLDRGEVDQLFLEIMKDEGISWWRRYFAYLAVRVFGELSWQQN
ncbi:MAG: DUF1353 domain-containing protein [Pseudomonadota bacterium]